MKDIKIKLIIALLAGLVVIGGIAYFASKNKVEVPDETPDATFVPAENEVLAVGGVPEVVLPEPDNISTIKLCFDIPVGSEDGIKRQVDQYFKRWSVNDKVDEKEPIELKSEANYQYLKELNSLE